GKTPPVILDHGGNFVHHFWPWEDRGWNLQRRRKKVEPGARRFTVSNEGHVREVELDETAKLVPASQVKPRPRAGFDGPCRRGPGGTARLIWPRASRCISCSQRKVSAELTPEQRSE